MIALLDWFHEIKRAVDGAFRGPADSSSWQFDLPPNISAHQVRDTLGATDHFYGCARDICKQPVISNAG
jgi:hypothetical protein